MSPSPPKEVPVSSCLQSTEQQTRCTDRNHTEAPISLGPWSLQPDPPQFISHTLPPKPSPPGDLAAAAACTLPGVLPTLLLPSLSCPALQRRKTTLRLVRGCIQSHTGSGEAGVRTHVRPPTGPCSCELTACFLEFHCGCPPGSKDTPSQPGPPFVLNRYSNWSLPQNRLHRVCYETMC